jgi:hypothetical protein
MEYKYFIWLTLAGLAECVSAIVYAVESQTLMITSFAAAFVVFYIGARLLKRDSKLEDWNDSEIRWLKQHYEKLRYKDRDKLREYTENRIKSLNGEPWQSK